MSSGALANRRFGGEEIACEVFLPQWLNVGPGLGSPVPGPWSTISENTKKSGKIFYYSFRKLNKKVLKMAEIVNKTGVMVRETGFKDCVNL